MKAALLSENNEIENIIIVEKLDDVPNCHFISEVSPLNIGDTYDKSLAEMGYKPNSIYPFIELENVAVHGETVELGNGGIWWLKQGSPFTLTANAKLPNSDMMVIIERVINGKTVIDDLRVKASIIDGLITMSGVLTQSGNYQITAERLNAGLEIIEAPFRLAFDKVEFDAYV